MPPACSLVSTTCTAGIFSPLGSVIVVHRNAAAVIDHGDRVVDVDDGIDARRIAGQRLVDRVVDHFVDQVVQSHLAGRADVHRRTKANRLQTFEHFDIVPV